MKRLHDSEQISVAERESQRAVAANNYKTLSAQAALTHLTGLHQMLRNMVALVNQQVLPRFAATTELSAFIDMLAIIVRSMQLRLERNLYLKKDDLDVSIDPSDSGFPLFVRDLHFLNKQREKALQLLPGLPDNTQLVEDAIFSIFRGVLPTDIIDLKMQQSLYRSLILLPKLEELRIQKPLSLGRSNDFEFFRLCLERLEENHNLPRFYTLQFRVTKPTQLDERLLVELHDAVRGSFTVTVARELVTMARLVEEINGIQLDSIQRVDIGPYYNQFTQNEAPVSALLEHGLTEDSVFYFRVNNVQRVSHQKLKGVSNWFRALATGDWHRGAFSPVLASPRYIVLPHRLIQKAHHHDIRLDAHVKMFGLDAKGELIESAE